MSQRRTLTRLILTIVLTVTSYYRMFKGKKLLVRDKACPKSKVDCGGWLGHTERKGFKQPGDTVIKKIVELSSHINIDADHP